MAGATLFTLPDDIPTLLDDVAILHLPADKDFLAGWTERPFDPAKLHESLDRHVSQKIRYRRLTGLLGRGYAPRYR